MCVSDVLVWNSAEGKIHKIKKDLNSLGFKKIWVSNLQKLLFGNNDIGKILYAFQLSDDFKKSGSQICKNCCLGTMI